MSEICDSRIFAMLTLLQSIIEVLTIRIGRGNIRIGSGIGDIRMVIHDTTLILVIITRTEIITTAVAQDDTMRGIIGRRITTAIGTGRGTTSTVTGTGRTSTGTGTSTETETGTESGTETGIGITIETGGTEIEGRKEETQP